MAPTPPILTRDDEIQVVRSAFTTLTKALANYKPEDRSTQDRLWAIVKTDIEKASAVFDAWFIGIR